MWRKVANLYNKDGQNQGHQSAFGLILRCFFNDFTMSNGHNTTIIQTTTFFFFFFGFLEIWKSVPAYMQAWLLPKVTIYDFLPRLAKMNQNGRHLPATKRINHNSSDRNHN